MQMSNAKRPSQGTAVFLFLPERSGYVFFPRPNARTPALLLEKPGFWTYCIRSLTITYFHTGNPHYHRR
ncbi:hypothetical protein, partial [Paraburkholderia tropica]|uniref:hypothetical protein n=1 Tax=Paraburkholderia tropica TaxID=92647 RepID=UPI001ABBFCA6